MDRHGLFHCLDYDGKYEMGDKGWIVLEKRPTTNTTKQGVDWREASERAQPFIDDVVNRTQHVDWSKSFKEATHALVTCPNWVSENQYIGQVHFAKFKNGNYISEDGDRFIVGGGRWKVIEVRPTAHGAVDDVDDTVTQRGERYGLFADGAVIMQDLKAVMRATPGWERLTPSQREALEMIQHKIGRVLNGDPMYDDSWRDIAGYATLILNELNGVKR